MVKSAGTGTSCVTLLRTLAAALLITLRPSTCVEHPRRHRNDAHLGLFRKMVVNDLVLQWKLFYSEVKSSRVKYFLSSEVNTFKLRR